MEVEKEIVEKYNICLSMFLPFLRKELKLTQKELAELMNKSEITIRNYEKNRLKVTYEVLFYLIHYFSLTPAFVHNSFMAIMKGMKKAEIGFSVEEEKKIITLLHNDLKKIYNVKSLNLAELDIKSKIEVEKTVLLNQLYKYMYLKSCYLVTNDSGVDKKARNEFVHGFLDYNKLISQILGYIDFILDFEFKRR